MALRENHGMIPDPVLPNRWHHHHGHIKRNRLQAIRPSHFCCTSCGKSSLKRSSRFTARRSPSCCSKEWCSNSCSSTLTVRHMQWRLAVAVLIANATKAVRAPKPFGALAILLHATSVRALVGTNTVIQVSPRGRHHSIGNTRSGATFI